MSNQTKNPNAKIYDLEDRTAKFGEEIIDFVKTLLDNPINRPLISQIVRCATSIGANYMEADGAESKKDFNGYPWMGWDGSWQRTSYEGDV